MSLLLSFASQNIQVKDSLTLASPGGTFMVQKIPNFSYARLLRVKPPN